MYVCMCACNVYVCLHVCVCMSVYMRLCVYACNVYLHVDVLDLFHARWLHVRDVVCPRTLQSISIIVIIIVKEAYYDSKRGLLQ